MDQGGRDDGPDGPGVASAARRSFLRGFSRDAARSAGTLMGAIGAISGAPAAIGADLLGLRGRGEADDVPPVPEVARATAPVATPPPPADLRPWRRDGGLLRVVDQRLLPGAHVELPADSVAAVTALLESGAVPAGPAVAEVAVQAYAAFARETLSGANAAGRVRSLGWNLRLLRSARPASGALATALARLEAVFAGAGQAPDPGALLEALEAEVDAVVGEIAGACTRLIDVAADLLAHHLGEASGLLTLGTSGPLAGGGSGTAIGVIAEVARRMPGTRAWVAETRPSLVGARVGALELSRLGVPVTVVPDAAVAELARAGRIRAAIVPAEGLTPDGDLVAIAGTAGIAAQLAVAGVPLIVTAPSMVTATRVAAPTAGSTSPRSVADLLTAEGRRVAAPGADGWAPLVDLTPRALLRGLVDEGGAHALDAA